MKELAFYDTTPFDELAWPELNKRISLESSALEIFTDFEKTQPMVIDSSMSAVDAEKLMQTEHVRLKFVVNSNNHLLGVVSLEDLNSREILKRVSKGENREELSVTDFMRPRNKLKSFDYSDLAHASIKDVIGSLKNSGYRHCLVVDHKHHKIRGIISASDIARSLQLQINIKSDSSFVGIFKAIQH